MQQHPDQCRTEILPCHRTAKKKCSFSDRLCILQSTVFTKISQINYLDFNLLEVSQCERPYRIYEYVCVYGTVVDTYML